MTLFSFCWECGFQPEDYLQTFCWSAQHLTPKLSHCLPYSECTYRLPFSKATFCWNGVRNCYLNTVLVFFFALIRGNLDQLDGAEKLQSKPISCKQHLCRMNCFLAVCTCNLQWLSGSDPFQTQFSGLLGNFLWIP